MLIRRKNYYQKGILLRCCKLILSLKAVKGKYESLFEKELQKKFQTQMCIATSSGLQALKIILSFYSIKTNEKIAIPVYTADVVLKLLEEMSISYVFVDLEPGGFNMDPKDLERKISPSVKLVLVTHLFGTPCSTKIFDICKSHGIIAVEDCAHSFGARFPNGELVGTVGDASFFSYGFSKPINILGGGSLLTKNAELFEFAKKSIAHFNPFRLTTVLLKCFVALLEAILASNLLSRFYVGFLEDDKKLKRFLRKFKSLRRGNLVNRNRLSNLQCMMGYYQLLDYSNKDLILEKRFDSLRTKIGCVQYGLGLRNYHYLLVKVKKISTVRKELLKVGVDSGGALWLMDFLGQNEDSYPNFKDLKCSIIQIPNYKDYDMNVREALNTLKQQGLIIGLYE